MHNFATLFSLLLTPMTILACAYVVYKFRLSFSNAMSKKDKTELNWFVIGIVVGFAGSLADNLYWGAAWTANFLALESTSWWFDNGVFSNSVFRQGCGVISALCHLKGVSSVTQGKRTIRKVVYGGAFLGIFFTTYLVTVAPCT